MHCTHSCSFCMQAFILYCSSTDSELHSYLTKFLLFCWLDVLTFLEQVNIVVRDLVIKGSLLGGTAEVYQPPLIHDGTHSFTVSQHTTSSLHKKVSNAQTPLWLLRAILLYAALSCTACSNYYTSTKFVCNSSCIKSYVSTMHVITTTCITKCTSY